MFLLSMLGSLGSSLWGGITSLFMKGASGLGSLLWNGIKILVVGGVKGILGLLAGGALGFVTLLKSSMDALRDFSRTVIGISNQSGASLQHSLALVNGMRAFGISPEETAAAFGNRGMNPQLFDMRANRLGAPNVENPSFGLKLNQWFQSMTRDGSMLSFLAGRARLDSLFGGNAPDSILRLVNMRPETIKREQAWHSSLQDRLGLSPEVLTQANEGLGLLINRIGVFADAVKMKFVAELLPTLEGGFNFVSEMLLKNTGSISKGIRAFADWLFIEAPDLAVEGLRTLSGWGQAFSDTIFNLGDDIVNLLLAMNKKQGAFYDIGASIAKFIDDIVNFGRDLGAGLAVFGQLIENFFATNPIWKAAAKYLGFNPTYRDPVKVSTNYYNTHAASNVFGRWNAFSTSQTPVNAANSLASMIINGRARSAAAITRLNNLADVLDRADGTKSEREKLLQQIRDEIHNVGEDVVGAITNSNQYQNAAIGHVGASFAMRSARLRRT